jgi:hypothetical protein
MNQRFLQPIRLGRNGMASLAAAWLFLAGSADAAVDFGREVLPILSDKCYHCHGPDEKARKAKLRFDTKEGAFRLKDGKAAIVPGKSAESEIIRRLLTSDPDDKMPPPEANRPLTTAQVDTLRRWVDEGARWGKHWAFEAVDPVDPPAVKTPGWTRGPIDQFILARLEQEGLKPSPEADRERLIRRISFDLTGLPPSVAEIDTFLRDTSPDAYEHLVDRLLDSPRYGERMAGDWLDLARYSDTHGYQMDRYRPMWPWRNWVIDSFNRNQPFDQFVTWQLAGDLLRNATKEQRLATAFNRLHLQNEEGGIVEEEFRVAYVVDRVNTFGTAFLGVTFECSRCHDHKYDPISQRDFYQLFSLFQNIDESGQTVYFGEVMPVPTLLLSTDEQDKKLSDLQRRIRSQAESIAALKSAHRPDFEEWLRHRPAQPSVPGLTASYSFDELQDGHFTNAVAGGKPANAADGPALVPGHSGQGVEMNGDNGINFPGAGGFTRATPFSLSLWINPATRASRAVVLHKSRAWMDAGSRGYELLIEEGHLSVGLHRMWPGNSIKIRTTNEIPVQQWTHVTVTYDGSSRAAGLHLYLNGLPIPTETIRDGLWRDFTYGGDEPDLTIGYRMRDNGFKGGKVDDLHVFDRELTPLEAAHESGRDDLKLALAAPLDNLTPLQRDQLFDYYVHTADSGFSTAYAELTLLRQEQNQLVTSIQDIMVMQEMPQPKRAFILKRGAYDAPADEVFAGTPAALPSLPANAPRNRLGLAQWLTAPENPLFARVTVNRAWQQLFGRGLVETSDNFGTQGSFPSHPDLLDWLAGEFRAKGWNMKALLKEIALSATYRQSSIASPDLLARDPDNHLLARGPARRLGAEMLRDQALAVSGLISEHLGGPSVRPYQPEGLWEVAMGNPKYDQGHGDDLHRRSLYTFWKRTVPPPTMITFDAAERNVCVVRRQTTSTPLQALALLNDPQIVESARFVAERLLREGGPTLEDRVSYAFRLVTGRRPTTREVGILVQLFKEQHDLYAAEPDMAAKLIAVGETKNNATLDPADLAAGTVLAKALLNHDEAIMRR